MVGMILLLIIKTISVTTDFQHQEEVLDISQDISFAHKMVLNDGLKDYKEQIKLKSPMLCFWTCSEQNILYGIFKHIKRFCGQFAWMNMIFFTKVYLSFLAQNRVETLDFPLWPSLQATHSSVKLRLIKVAGKGSMMWAQAKATRAWESFPCLREVIMVFQDI